jgi:NADH-quinone oxidoreductase subunit N
LLFSRISHAGLCWWRYWVLVLLWKFIVLYVGLFTFVIAIFCVVLVCKNRDNEDIVNFHGLNWNQSIVSYTFVMLRIPIFAGFAKLVLFETIQAGIFGFSHCSCCEFNYYRVWAITSINLLAMYTKEPNEEKRLSCVYT